MLTAAPVVNGGGPSILGVPRGQETLRDRSLGPLGQEPLRGPSLGPLGQDPSIVINPSPSPSSPTNTEPWRPLQGQSITEDHKPNRVSMREGKTGHKPAQAAINDQDGFRMRAACVCFKSRREEEVLLVSSLGGSGWIIPGGKVDPKEVDNPSVSAVREAREEAGVIGQLGRFLGVFENAERGHRTRVFVMYVERLEPEGEWEESERRRKWFPVREARELLRANKPNHAKYLEGLELPRSA